MPSALAVSAAVAWVVAVAVEYVHGPLNEDGERPVLDNYYCVAENARGDRYRTVFGWTTEEEALRFAERANWWVAHKGASPKGSDKWHATHPRYGSTAYQDYGQYEELQWEAKVNEEMEWSRFSY